MKQNLTFEDLEGALMLISFDTVDEDGVVEGVEHSLGTVATLDLDWENSAELAEHIKSGCYVEIKRAMSWHDWN
ncbi:MAG: hypothetical protein IJ998_09345 [Alistipes sp.]|nr:hypothetical protein [Alistipes sp.]